LVEDRAGYSESILKIKLRGKIVKQLKATYRLIGNNTSTGCFPCT